METGPGLGLESSQRSVRVEHASPPCTKATCADRDISMSSVSSIYLPVLISSWITLRSTKSLLNGAACACDCSGLRTRQERCTAEAHDHRARHRAREIGGRHPSEQFFTCLGHAPIHEASRGAPEGCTRRAKWGVHRGAPQPSPVSPLG